MRGDLATEGRRAADNEITFDSLSFVCLMVLLVSSVRNDEVEEDNDVVAFLSSSIAKALMITVVHTCAAASTPLC